MIIAHTPNHLLKDHLIATAEKARQFSREFSAEEWGYLAGLLHDLGKYSSEFQEYLHNQDEACAESQPGRIDHSTAGAQYAVNVIPLVGHLLAYVIAGHHSGLLDGRAEGACQEARLAKQIYPLKHGLQELPDVSKPELPALIRMALGQKDSFRVAFFIRMIFSCLVDADFLDTERFMDSDKYAARGRYPEIKDFVGPFYKSLMTLEKSAPETTVNRKRREVREACEKAADETPGFFSLTVPTGGGKTLASLLFALRHAAKYNLHRIIYVVPFTNIIEQNADVFRRYLDPNVVLEHHCNIDSEKETLAARLASENWDAPLIVTTSVQFYESLFANRTSRCRKLHRLASSIIILDEAQTLPVDYLKPCLSALKELQANYRSTIVLCTATQPEIRKRPEFEIGLEGVREIIAEPKSLYHSLRRVAVEDIGQLSDEGLVSRMLNEERVLCIVNTTKHARLVFEKLGPNRGHFHLSARICPEHRRLRLWQIRRTLKNSGICRVISTQVVEAGVDIDFPVVYRALAGLDSIAQAAGRCNRNGLLPTGRTFVFQTEHATANRYFADTAQCAAQVMEKHKNDLLALSAIEHFFRLYYWDQKIRWDAHGILDHFRLVQDNEFPFDFDFATVGREFHLIDDKAQCAVIIPWGRRGRKLCERLRAMPAPTREILRQAQRYIVQVHRRVWNDHAGRDIKLISDRLGILDDPKTYYRPDTGLNLETTGPGFYMA
ncbi:MAG TPA: CRISPR-associated helicase Cas3' [Desulfobacteraceae bacterium]|nr:CRISPR-associated helicase Cas3' [Desulfobacteraceae bacterium]